MSEITLNVKTTFFVQSLQYQSSGNQNWKENEVKVNFLL